MNSADTIIPHLETMLSDATIRRDEVLAPHSYFKIGGPAEIFVETADHEDIAALFAYSHEENIPLTLIGGASNVLIDDTGIDGIVLHITDRHTEVVEETEEHIILEAGAGLQTALLVRTSVDVGATGLEYFLGVPGTVGGAIYNNAHYLEDLIGDSVQCVTAATAAGDVVTYDHAELDFAYEHSRFQTHDEVILQATFALERDDDAVAQTRITEAAQYRARTQPLGAPSSGCIFQNVPNTEQLRERFPQFAERAHLPAGFLIDQAGLKGTTQGAIEISEKHAAFFINTGDGSSDDVHALVEHVKATVQDAFDISLQEEIFYLGGSPAQEA